MQTFSYHITCHRVHPLWSIIRRAMWAKRLRIWGHENTQTFISLLLLLLLLSIKINCLLPNCLVFTLFNASQLNVIFFSSILHLCDTYYAFSFNAQAHVYEHWTHLVISVNLNTISICRTYRSYARTSA